MQRDGILVFTYASHIPPATAAALPPELPPADRFSRPIQGAVSVGVEYGLTTGPYTEYVFRELYYPDQKLIFLLLYNC